MNISVTKSASIRTGENGAELTANIYPEAASQNVTWSIDSKYARLNSNKGKTISIEGNNNEEKAIDACYPLDQYIKWAPAQNNSWDYVNGINGAANGSGLLTIGRGARLLYTQDGKFGNMEVHLTVDPEKTAAQGFGSANGQYLEIYIKYDTRTKTGYGLRIERTIKCAFATDFTLYEYMNGISKPISQSISTTAFNTKCTIDLKAQNNILTAKSTSTAQQSADQIKAEISKNVFLSGQILENQYGGMGIQHTGTVGDGGRIQLKTLSISY